MQTVVQQRQGHEVASQEAGLAFAAPDGCLPHACWPYRPQTKGKTERLMGFVHDDCCLGRVFQDLADLNRPCAAWRTEVNQRPHGTTRVPPVVRWHLEQTALLPLPTLNWDPTPVETRLVQRACFIAYGAKRYSMPHPDGGQCVTVKADTAQRRIPADTVLIATHAVASGTGQMVVDPAHYVGLQPPCHPTHYRSPAPPEPAPAAPRGVRWDHPALTGVVDRRPLSVYAARCEAGGGAL